MRPDKLYKHTLCCLYPDVLKTLATGNRIRNMGSCYSQETGTDSRILIKPDRGCSRIFQNFFWNLKVRKLRHREKV